MSCQPCSLIISSFACSVFGVTSKSVCSHVSYNGTPSQALPPQCASKPARAETLRDPSGCLSGRPEPLRPRLAAQHGGGNSTASCLTGRQDTQTWEHRPSCNRDRRVDPVASDAVRLRHLDLELCVLSTSGRDAILVRKPHSRLRCATSLRRIRHRTGRRHSTSASP